MRVRGMLCAETVADDAKPPVVCMLIQCPPLLLLQNYVSSTPARFKTKKNFWLTSFTMKDLTSWPSLRHGSRRCMGSLLSLNSVQTATPALTDQDPGREVGVLLSCIKILFSIVASRDLIIRHPNIWIFFSPFAPPPSKSSLCFLEEFSQLLDSVILSAACLLIVGDFNYHVDSQADTAAVNFLHLIESYGLPNMSPLQLTNTATPSTLSLPVRDNLIASTITDGFFSDYMSVFCSLCPRLPRETCYVPVLQVFLTRLFSVWLDVTPSYY